MEKLVIKKVLLILTSLNLVWSINTYASLSCELVVKSLKGELTESEINSYRATKYRKWLEKNIKIQKNDNLTKWGEHLRIAGARQEAGSKESSGLHLGELQYVLKHLNLEKSKELKDRITEEVENLVFRYGKDQTREEILSTARQQIIELSHKHHSTWSKKESLRFYLSFQTFLIANEKHISQRFSNPYVSAKTASSTSKFAFRDQTLQSLYSGIIPTAAIVYLFYTAGVKPDLLPSGVLAGIMGLYSGVRVAQLGPIKLKIMMDKFHYFIWRNKELKSLAKEFGDNQPIKINDHFLLGSEIPSSFKMSEADKMRQLFDIYRQVSVRIHAQYDINESSKK